MRLELLVCIVQFCVSIAANSSNDDFTCVAGSFKNGQRGHVTCHFGPNIHTANYHFEIVKYPFDSSGSHSGDDVLRCYSIPGGKLACDVGTGYEFDEKLHDNLTVFVPNVTQDFAGRYACQLIPPEERQKRLCYLNVRGTKPSSASRVQVDGSDGSDSQTGTILAAIFGALLFPCIIFVFVILCRKLKKAPQTQAMFATFTRRRKKRADNRPSQDEEDASREPFIIHIVPFDETQETLEEDTTEQTKKLQPPRPCRPFREAYRRDAYTTPVEPSTASVSENGNGFIARQSVEEETQHDAQHATAGQKMFSMPSILPFEKLDDKDKTDQAPPQNVKMTETGLRRPKLVP